MAAVKNKMTDVLKQYFEVTAAVKLSNIIFCIKNTVDENLFVIF